MARMVSAGARVFSLSWSAVNVVCVCLVSCFALSVSLCEFCVRVVLEVVHGSVLRHGSGIITCVSRNHAVRRCLRRLGVNREFPVYPLFLFTSDLVSVLS